jgi:hypothetical protein
MAKAENCETVRAGMGLLVGGNMGKERSRDRWLGMEKTEYHFLQCLSGRSSSIELVVVLPQQQLFIRTMPPVSMHLIKASYAPSRVQF